MKLDPIEDAVAAIANGECIIVVDDADRENEGDLVMAASKASKESMAFIIKAGGLVCAPITASEARRLKLEPMARENDAPLSTAFTVSVDYKEGLTTGINATERASTVRALRRSAHRPFARLRMGMSGPKTLCAPDIFFHWLRKMAAF